MKICCKLVLNYILAFSLINLTSLKLMRAQATEHNLKSIAPNSKSQLKKQATQKFEKEKVTKIKNLNQLAELEFLNDDLLKSYSTYETISDQALDSMWPDKARQIIFQSFFRRSQIKSEEASKLISKAITYAYDLEPNKELTPPKLYQQYQDIKNWPEFINLNLNKTQKTLVNGSSKITKVHRNKIYRLDTIKKGSPDITNYIVGSKIFSYSPNSTSSNAMTSKPHDQPAIGVEKSIAELPTQLPLKLSPNFTYNEPLSLKSDFSSKTNFKPKKNITWVYVASSILAVTLGAVLINKSNDNSNSYEPTSKQGF
jgi:hypothetical protein